MTDSSSDLPSGVVEVATESHLDWSSLGAHVHARLSSPAAKDRLCTSAGEPDAHAILPRSLEVGAVAAQLRALDGLELALRLAADLDERVSVSAELLNVVDVADVVRRAAKGALLDVGELCATADVVAAGSRIGAVVAAVRTRDSGRATETEREALAYLRKHLRMVAPPRGLADTLERSLERSGEPRLADTASDVLGRLRGRLKQARRSLVTAAERFLKRQGLRRALADNYWTERDGRVVVPVRSDGFSRAGGQGTVSGIIHGASGSGQTLFVEPGELIDDNNAVREATTAVRTEERRILQRLSALLGDGADALRASLDALCQLDLWHARLRVCRDLDAHAPNVSTAAAGNELSLPQARHPLMVLAGADVVPNDLAVGVGTSLVISGPNAGGKTVALKTVGLCVMMAQAGLRLPTAPGARVPLFSSVVTDVGDDQSISANLSTFSAHIKHVLEAFDACGDSAHPLVLLDEVAVGTDPDQGAALAEAILRGLVERGATQIVTTHYERLKLLASQESGKFTNAAVGFDLEQLRPTFHVRMGTPGSSSALAVARRLGLPEEVLGRAEDLLAGARVRVDALLQEVDAERHKLAGEREEQQRQRLRLDEERAALQRQQERAETTAAGRRKKAHEAATAALRQLEDELKARRKRLRKRGEISVDGSGVTDPTEREFAREAGNRIGKQRPAPRRPDSAGDVPEHLSVGDRVRVVPLDTEAEVVTIKGDRVTVAAGAIKTTVSREDLRTTKSSKRPKPASAPRPSSGPNPRRFFGSEAAAVEEAHDNVLDLRGVRADEALTMLEVFLDRSISYDQDVVIVRHGHGSGALRRVVREHLPRLSHVQRHRPGLPIEGGDAVTVVWVSM